MFISSSHVYAPRFGIKSADHHRADDNTDAPLTNEALSALPKGISKPFTEELRRAQDLKTMLDALCGGSLTRYFNKALGELVKRRDWMMGLPDKLFRDEAILLLASSPEDREPNIVSDESFHYPPYQPKAADAQVPLAANRVPLMKGGRIVRTKRVKGESGTYNEISRRFLQHPEGLPRAGEIAKILDFHQRVPQSDPFTEVQERVVLAADAYGEVLRRQVLTNLRSKRGTRRHELKASSPNAVISLDVKIASVLEPMLHLVFGENTAPISLFTKRDTPKSARLHLYVEPTMRVDVTQFEQKAPRVKGKNRGKPKIVKKTTERLEPGFHIIYAMDSFLPRPTYMAAIWPNGRKESTVFNEEAAKYKQQEASKTGKMTRRFERQVIFRSNPALLAAVKNAQRAQVKASSVQEVDTPKPKD